MKRGLVTVLCTLLLCFMGVPITVFAEGSYNSIVAKIPVYCYDTDELTYEVRIEAENMAPVPYPDKLYIIGVNYDNKTSTTTTVGDGAEAQCFYINVNEPGTFIYKIYECPGEKENIQYDNTVYNLTIYVENKTDTELVYAVTLASDDNNHKPEVIEFHNKVYGYTETTSPLETDDDSATDTGTTMITDSDQTDTNITTSTSTTGIETVNTTKITNTTTVVTETTSTTTTNTWYEELLTPLTGDNTPVAVMMILVVIAGALSVITFIMRKNENEGGESFEDEDDS